MDKEFFKLTKEKITFTSILILSCLAIYSLSKYYCEINIIGSPQNPCFWAVNIIVVLIGVIILFLDLPVVLIGLIFVHYHLKYLGKFFPTFFIVLSTLWFYFLSCLIYKNKKK
jgi:hypothetical protein